MYGRISDKIELGLPATGVRIDGRMVSNYNMLEPETLLAEGWKPIEEVKPAFDVAAQYLVVDTAIDTGDRITVTHKVINIPR